MTGLADPQRPERVAERGAQPDGIGQVSQQSGAGMPDDTRGGMEPPLMKARG
jgi:hypothetical protein